MSLWCGRGDLNYSIALITRNLLILHPGVKAQMPHNPASLVRLLYGERAQKRKPRRSAFSQSFQQQFDTRHSHRPRPRFENPSGHFSRRSSQTGIIAGTGLPLVLISHGTAASEASHYDAVLALADEGFVVAALTHTCDNYMDQSYVGNRKDLTDRPHQGECCLELHAHNLGTARALAISYAGLYRRWELRSVGVSSRLQPKSRCKRFDG